MNTRVLHKARALILIAAFLGIAGISHAATTPAKAPAAPAAPVAAQAVAPVATPVSAPAAVAASPAPSPAAAVKKDPIETQATHAILVDVNTGAILLNKNADDKMPTSSMSKTVSLYLVFDALKKGQWKLTDELPVSEKAWKMGGSKMFIKVGTKVKVEDLIRGVATISGNDAVVCLAEGLAGSEDDFTDRINALAKNLGMTNSHFMNASGWPVDGHYSTPRDLATIGQHLIKDFPEYYHYFSEKDFTYNSIKQPATDPLIGKVQGVDGIKTGHTDIAGYGLISSAMRDGRRLILVMNGLPTNEARATEGARLLEWGFRNFEDDKVLSKDEEVDKAKVWLGEEDEVPLVVENDVTLSMPAAKHTDLKMAVHYKGPIEAPIRKGTVIGKLHIVVPDQEPQDIDLVAGKDVEREGLFGRVASRLHYLLGGV